jgi:hypothetical protein
MFIAVNVMVKQVQCSMRFTLHHLSIAIRSTIVYDITLCGVLKKAHPWQPEGGREGGSPCGAENCLIPLHIHDTRGPYGELCHGTGTDKHMSQYNTASVRTARSPRLFMGRTRTATFTLDILISS